MYTTLISPRQLMDAPGESLIVLDCRFQLDDPDYGHAAYERGHIPGAHYLHLDYHLSGSKNGQNGRHPLPDGQRLAVDLGALGVGEGTQVVAYDDGTGQYAARAWWLLRWLGHGKVAVLDGGIAAWLAAGGPLSQEKPQRRPCRYVMRQGLQRPLEAADVLANLDDKRFTVVDARSPQRFRGIGETIDPVGGHIPGAANRFFMDNLTAEQHYKPAEQLRAEWEALLGEGFDPAAVVHQCGSGVTACHNLLSMEIAGFRGSRLYPGSWSEWCSDPSRPVER
ncbi:sulfurtransferase [Chromobacterium phragmitis]|uniref:Sulfurtransferase n=1 Tax=Chromobacterium phragmitis TaxID=2202141 RepID=A0A344UK26_9NEIS|nr:sulfurtransferase [Chromobacterium phragmitis]AXE30230.1 sulfurtransferase [Chromobacterium phragmitis]AXE35624.1 sulfurtransferase [Chromobacterium phragmitis]